MVNSIHSFTQSSIGPWFLGFICTVTAFAWGSILYRLPLLRATTRLESLVSREATFLYNNLLLVALCLTILWGVAWPILTEAVRGEARVVGRPYYDFFLRAFGLPLLLLMGIGPLIAWRRASIRARARRSLGPVLVALAVGVVLLVLGAGSSTPGLIAYTFSAFVLGHDPARVRARHTRPAGLVERIVARCLLVPDRAKPATLRRLHRPRRHRPARDRGCRIECLPARDRQELAPGQSLAVGGYTLTYRKLEQRTLPNATETARSST